MTSAVRAGAPECQSPHHCLTVHSFPAISAAPGQFLLKDLVLLAASFSLVLASVQGPWLNVQKS